MKKLRYKLLALALCCVLALGLTPKAEGAAVYFMSVNDTLLELRSSTMPLSSNGVLYIPYIMLNPTLSGVNLGVSAIYSAAKNQALVYATGNMLVFDIDGNTTYDSGGEEYPERAIVRNSMVYLPLARICDLFPAIEYSVTETENGTLVRVTNSLVVLDDEAFISAAFDNMAASRARYEQELAAMPSTPPGGGSFGGPGGSGAEVYLAFDMGGEQGADRLLATLEQWECQGLFFFEEEELAARDDLVRQLVGRGHLIGLKLPAATGDEAREELESGEALLRQVARCRVTAVLAEGLAQADRAALEEEGWPCWDTTTDGRTMTGGGVHQANQLLRQMSEGPDADNRLLLDEAVGPVLSTVLSAIREADYRLRAPVSTAI